MRELAGSSTSQAENGSGKTQGDLQEDRKLIAERRRNQAAEHSSCVYLEPADEVLRVRIVECLCVCVQHGLRDILTKLCVCSHVCRTHKESAGCVNIGTGRTRRLD